MKMTVGGWRFRVVGEPGRSPFFVVRQNARNNVAYGPFTRTSFPLSCRPGGAPVPPEHVGDAREAIREIDRLKIGGKNGSTRK